MQKRLIEELAECRGGPNRLKKMRKEFEEKYNLLAEQLEELTWVLAVIDEVTGKTEAAAEDAYQEASEAVTEREPVDSIGE